MLESSTLLQSLRQSLLRFVDALPDLLLALVLLIAGWLLAKLVRRLLIRVMRAGRVDEFAERSGLDDFLVRGGVEQTTVAPISTICLTRFSVDMLPEGITRQPIFSQA